MRITISLLSLLISTALFGQDGWELKKDKDGIKAFTKRVEGSAMKAIKATTEFNCSLETCVAVLRDIPHLVELFPDCEKAKKIKQTENEQVHYLHLKAPWPVADREGIFHLIYSYDASNNSVLVKATIGVGDYPEQKGLVRMNKGGGTWEFKKVDNNKTSLRYYFHGDPGGSIPAWLTNSVADENPYRMLLNFHNLVKLDRYQGQTFSFIP